MTAALVTAANWVLAEAAACLDDTSKDIETAAAPTMRRIHFGEIGSVVWDNCCEGRAGTVGGQLTASVGRITAAPRRDGTSWQPRCAGGWELPVTIQVLRCAVPISAKGVVDWSALDVDAGERLDEALALSCHFGSLFGGVDGYEGTVNAMSTIEEGSCRAVRVELTVHLL